MEKNIASGYMSELTPKKRYELMGLYDSLSGSVYQKPGYRHADWQFPQYDGLEGEGRILYRKHIL